MRDISETLRLNKKIRVIGFDDAPFERENSAPVNVSGIVCSNTRFEGMLWGAMTKDGDDATDTMINMVADSKFRDQAQLLLTDGIAMGGFNVVDLARLSHTLALPCIAVMRKAPDLDAIDKALQHFSDCEQRKKILAKAGEIYQQSGFIYQVSGCSAELAAQALRRLTDTGKVPEALRLAHLIGAAVKFGQSGKRA